MSHQARVLAYLKKHGSITPMSALQMFGCYRLGARIMELRQQGHEIFTEITREGRKIKSRYIYIKDGNNK